MANQYPNKIIFGDGTILDLTQDTVTASKLFKDVTAHDKSGAIITGTYNPYPTISVTTPPTKTEYQIGETLDLTGMVVTATLDNGYSKDITSECTFSPADGATLTSSDQSIDISYTFLGETLHGTQNIDVAYVDHIYVATPPTKTTYQDQDILDLSGIVVKAVWGDESETDITSACTFNPVDGSTVTEDTSGVDISWTWSITGQTFTTRQAISIFTPYSWATGTDEQVAYMLQLHYDNVIDLHDFWHVGDKRSITMSAIPRDDSKYHAFTEWPQETMDFVLSEVGGKDLVNPINGHTECAFQVDTKQTAELNATFIGGGNKGWSELDNKSIRAFCNNAIRNSIPSSIRGVFKQHKNLSALYGSTTLAETDDYFALRSAVEVFGENPENYRSGEGTQITYYKNSSNRYKTYAISRSSYATWWLRSNYIKVPNAYCQTYQNGNFTASEYFYNASFSFFGCI